MKRAGIFNPYWNTLGGGERYTATVVKALETAGYAVSIYWSDKTLLKQLRTRFDLDLINTTIDSLGYETLAKKSIWQKMQLESDLDCLFWVSDGSIPFMFARQNLLHFQVPFHDPITNQLGNKIKFSRINHVICNSNFTKKIIDTTYGCESAVVYPPVHAISSGNKKPIVLSVGRFDNAMHSKRQDVLIESFKELNASGWQLILAGGSAGENTYLTKLKKQIGPAPITLLVNPTFSKLQEVYASASIYWHAAGFGSDLTKHPERAEHFGISTVEAMSAGAVPIVFAGGGQKEIVHPGENGLLWTTKTELINQTKNLIKDKIWLSRMQQALTTTAIQFSETRFIDEFITLLG